MNRTILYLLTFLFAACGPSVPSEVKRSQYYIRLLDQQKNPVSGVQIAVSTRYTVFNITGSGGAEHLFADTRHSDSQGRADFLRLRTSDNTSLTFTKDGFSSFTLKVTYSDPDFPDRNAPRDIMLWREKP